MSRQAYLSTKNAGIAVLTSWAYFEHPASGFRVAVLPAYVARCVLGAYTQLCTICAQEGSGAREAFLPTISPKTPTGLKSPATKFRVWGLFGLRFPGLGLGSRV